MKVSQRRRRTQGGQEIVEFAFVALLFIPLIMGMFSTGMNLIVSIQANNLVRSLANLSIHGADFSTYPYQQLAQRMATGLGLQFPAFSGNTASNLGTSGNAIIRLTQIMYVGSNTDPNCVAVGATNCVNRNSFVFTQRVAFGSSTVAAARPSFVGDPTGATISSTGAVSSPVTSPYAKLGTTGQAAMVSLWQTTANGQQPLRDGQVLYLAEGYFETPLASVGMFQSNGVYARFFF
jgi:hypothetical protein